MMELEGKAPASAPVIMEALSSRYGWTPEQIRAMRESDVLAYLEIIEARAQIEKAKSMRSA